MQVLIGAILGYLLDFVVKAFGDLLRPTTQDLLQGLIARYRRLYPPLGGVRVHFAFDGEEAKHADEVFVAGDFNQWLQAESKLIHPWSWQRKAYGLVRRESQGHMVWEKDILIKPGHYDFKFVVGSSLWIHWRDGIGYPRGSDAPGGPNFLLIVEPLPSERMADLPEE